MRRRDGLRSCGSGVIATPLPPLFFLLPVAVVAERFLGFVSRVSIDDSLRAKVKKPTVPPGAALHVLRGPQVNCGRSVVF